MIARRPLETLPLTGAWQRRKLTRVKRKSLYHLLTTTLCSRLIQIRTSNSLLLQTENHHVTRLSVVLSTVRDGAGLFRVGPGFSRSLPSQR